MDGLQLGVSSGPVRHLRAEREGWRAREIQVDQRICMELPWVGVGLLCRH